LPNRNSLHDRFLAWFMARGGETYTSFMEGRKKNLLSGLSGTLVEIGSGTGPNLQYLPDHLSIVGMEPNPFMHKHFLQEARNRGGSAHLIQGLAQDLPFADETVDVVLSTLVLCSVPDLQQVFAEVLRVLKPGGKFLFLEHVAAGENTRLRQIQEILQPLWAWVGDGCQLNRSTGAEIEKAGFRKVQIEQFLAPLPLVSPHIVGVAEK
jgi:ubiquinone/menaquinone biosynthesis C-methylase UbiE